MTFAQRRNRLTTHFSEHIPVVKRLKSVLTYLYLPVVGHTSPGAARDMPVAIFVQTTVVQSHSLPLSRSLRVPPDFLYSQFCG